MTGEMSKSNAIVVAALLISQAILASCLPATASDVLTDAKGHIVDQYDPGVTPGEAQGPLQRPGGSNRNSDVAALCEQLKRIGQNPDYCQ